MLVNADLTFQVDLPAGSGRPTRCTGRVDAAGSEIRVRFDPMPSLLGTSAGSLVRPVADQLDRWGLTVQIVGPDGPVVRLGAGVRSPWWQAIATGGARVQLVSVWALVGSLRGPRVFVVALPSLGAFPAIVGETRAPSRRVVGRVRGVLRRLNRRR